jgi:hypothetical protein
MFPKILALMRERIRKLDYVVTFHADEAMNDDSLSIIDVENCLLSGEIIERQKDTLSGEWKYRIRGQAVSGDEVDVVAKIGASGKVFIITTYLA